MKLKKNLYALYLILLITGANSDLSIAQAFNDVNHTRLKLTKYEDVDGTPFFIDTWLPGNVKLSNGSSYGNLLLKYNQEEDQLYFRGKDDSEILTFVDPVNEFNITYAQNSLNNTVHYRNGYREILGTNANSFFEILVDGKIQLLKKTTKTIEEHKEYGSSILVKKMVTANKYYIFSQGSAKQIKLNNKAVLSVLDSPQLDSYIKSNNLNLKTESDMIKLINYYNTI